MAKKNKENDTIGGVKEQKFFETLKNIFIGVPVEGESGYINLMRIKAKYFERVMEPHLRSEIDEALKPFPNFREELFDKLYTFFKRYFTESGSIGFFFTPYHQSVYEQVYTDDRDVILFWKTARLYYVKTDRLFRSMEVSLDGFRFFFDVSTLEHKKANEKRELVFTFKERRSDGVFVFTVTYSERGSKTNIQEIRRAIKDALDLKNYTDAVPAEEILEKAFQLFERQSEVDYFICKDAKSFLREQFDLWMWQYIFGKPDEESQTEWTEERIKQLQTLKRIAYRVIDFISAFEDELVRIWNKPKFILRSNYVITLDRIYERRPELVERIISHPNFDDQVKEWKELKIVDENFTAENIYETNLEGKHLNPRYRFLPIDTRHFKDLELQILSLFENLDEALDGWLIKSENYQALKTILPKFKGKVQTIYIDPPFNKEQDADYHYSVKYKDATWITLLENRLRLARDLLKDTGSIFVRCDYNGNTFVRLLMNKVFEQENFRNELIVNRTIGYSRRAIKNLEVETEFLVYYAKNSENLLFNKLWKEREPVWMPMRVKWNKGGPTGKPIIIEGQVFNPPEGYSWFVGNEVAQEMYKQGRLKVENGKLIVLVDKKILGTNWTDIPGYDATSGWNFPTENHEKLLRRVIEMASNEGDLVMDFFLGSGTTCAVAHKLKRKWIGVEMGEHFWTVALPRMKKVLAYDPSGISKEKDVAEKYNKDKAGGFFKYYELEQYEETLNRTHYQDDDLFTPPVTEDPCQYLFLRDLKMLETLEVNLEQGTVKIDLSKLYNDIDLAETLSNLTGKWIKRIHPDSDDPTKPDKVEFADGTTVDLKNLNWKLIKPLVWW